MPPPPPVDRPTATVAHLPGRIGLRWFEMLMAARLLRSRRSAHLSLVTGLSVAGIALGVAALIVVLAVNTGFQVAFQERILASYPHLVVMQRGIDLRDWRQVVDRLQRVPEVRSAGPATYDDMMLSAAHGRGGAVVRGVGAQTLRNLPPGALVAGVIDVRGEVPQFSLTGTNLQVDHGVTGGRHLAIVAGSQVHWQPILATGSSLGGVVVFDAQRCGTSNASGPAEAVWLKSADLVEPLRSGVRKHCAVVGSWEALPGTYTLRWLADGTQRDQSVHLTEGRTAAVVIHGDSATFVPPPGDELGSMAAAVAALASNGSAVTLGVRNQSGQDPGSADKVWQALPAELPAIVVGEGLAQRLRVTVGDEIRAVSPLRGLDRASEGSDSSASGRFRVAAIVRTGFHDHDQRLALVDFVAAQRFLGRGDIARWVEARVTDPILASEHTERFAAALEPADLAELLTAARTLGEKLRQPSLDAASPPSNAVAAVDSWAAGLRTARQLRLRAQTQYRVIDWQEMNRNIFDAARMQKVAMSLFPFIIVLVAALNVVGTQAVIVHERARDIAILRAMGATRRSVAAVFLTQGLAVGLSGTAIGLLVGAVACWLLDSVGYPLDPQVYLISRLPVHAEAGPFVLAAAAAVVLSFGAAWLAAQRAAGRPPVEALRRLD
ncbi:MAG: ABC transporter permease [Myxococcales bacterium]|nr:ABC transporter permease [Myxococcales bacterium]